MKSAELCCSGRVRGGEFKGSQQNAIDVLRLPPRDGGGGGDRRGFLTWLRDAF